MPTIKFTKTVGTGRCPKTAVPAVNALGQPTMAITEWHDNAPCVTYALTVDGREVVSRTQWPGISEDLDRITRPHFYADRGWTIGLSHVEDGKVKWYGGARDEAHLKELQERAKTQGIQGLVATPLGS